jgi:intraflagellar transport protein 52
VPEAVQLYERLRVKHEPLRFTRSLRRRCRRCKPPFSRPFWEPPPPALDLFDLDEHFASERVRLAHLANKCNDDDMEYMCREAGVNLGITKELEEYSRSGKQVLEYASAFANWRVCAPYDHGECACSC